MSQIYRDYTTRMQWPEKYINSRRKGDRIKPAQILERRCGTCGDWFPVAPHRPDSNYCPSEACRKRRQRAVRSKEEHAHAGH